MNLFFNKKDFKGEKILLVAVLLFIIFLFLPFVLFSVSHDFFYFLILDS